MIHRQNLIGALLKAKAGRNRDSIIPAHSRVAIVCNLKEYHEVGDHYLYICNVEQVYGDETEEAMFAWNGYSQLRPAK